MASQNKIIEIVGAIKTIYSYYAKGSDVELLVKTWTALLSQYPDEAVDAAFYKCMQTCKVPPTPADVIEQINELNKINEPTDEELWVTYEKALRLTNYQMSRFTETFVDETGISRGNQARQKVDEIWDSLPEKIKLYLGSKGELMRNAREWNYDIDFSKWEKPRFIKAMPIMETRIDNIVYSDNLLNSGNKIFLLRTSND